MPLHVKRDIVNHAIWILEHIFVAFHVGKLCQLSFSHLVNDYSGPVMDIWLYAVLYVAQLVVKFL